MKMQISLKPIVLCLLSIVVLLACKETNTDPTTNSTANLLIGTWKLDSTFYNDDPKADTVGIYILTIDNKMNFTSTDRKNYTYTGIVKFYENPPILELDYMNGNIHKKNIIFINKNNMQVQFIAENGYNIRQFFTKGWVK